MATREQRTLLAEWSDGRWRAGAFGGWVKEMRVAHLVDAGLLEQGGHDDGLLRITTAGRLALSQEKNDD